MSQEQEEVIMKDIKRSLRRSIVEEETTRGPKQALHLAFNKKI